MGYYTALYCSLQEVLGILSHAARAVAKRTRESGDKRGVLGFGSALTQAREGEMIFKLTEVVIIRTQFLGATVTLFHPCSRQYAAL